MKKYQLKNFDEVFFEADTMCEIEQVNKNWRGFGGELIGLNLYEYGEFTGKVFNN